MRAINSMRKINFEKNFARLGALIGFVFAILIYSLLFISAKIGFKLLSFRGLPWKFLIISCIISTILGALIAIFTVNGTIKKNTHLKSHLILFIILAIINLFFIGWIQPSFKPEINILTLLFKPAIITLLIYLVSGFVFDRISNYFYARSKKNLSLILKLVFLIVAYSLSLLAYFISLTAWFIAMAFGF